MCSEECAGFTPEYEPVFGLALVILGRTEMRPVLHPLCPRVAQECKALFAGPRSFPHPLIDLLGDLLFRWHIGHSIGVQGSYLRRNIQRCILGYLVSSLLQGYMSGWTKSLFDPSGGLSVVKDLAVTAIVML